MRNMKAEVRFASTWRTGLNRAAGRSVRPRPPWGRCQPACPPGLRPRPRLDPALLARADWPEFWDAACRQLRSVGLRTGTLRVYRHVLRHFRTFLRQRGAGTRPGSATPALAREFLYRLSRRRASWSWTAAHISALRTVFDKLAGTPLTAGMPTPRRPRRIEPVLSPEEVGRMVASAASTRDRLVLLLLYGCGLRTSELCALRWEDVDLDGGLLRVREAGGGRERHVPLPRNTLPMLQAESFLRAGSDPVFPGARPGHGLCVRTAERIVRRAATRAGIAGEATCRTLRRSYAVECLRGGMNVVELGGYLGHRNVESTLAYLRHLAPRIVSPLDAFGSWPRTPVGFESASRPPALGPIRPGAP